MDSTETIRNLRKDLAEIEKVLIWMDKSKEIHQIDIDLLLNKSRQLYDRIINLPVGPFVLIQEKLEAIIAETAAEVPVETATPVTVPAAVPEKEPELKPEPVPEPKPEPKPEPVPMTIPEMVWEFDEEPEDEDLEDEDLEDEESEDEEESEPEPEEEPEPEPEEIPEPEPEPEPVTLPEPEPLWAPQPSQVRKTEPVIPPYQQPIRMPEKPPVRETVSEISLFQRDGSLNEALGKQKPGHDVASSIIEVPVADIWSAITINERFLFIRELFGNDAEGFKNTVTLLNSLSSWESAKKFMTDRFEWDKNNPVAIDFLNVVRRRFLK